MATQKAEELELDEKMMTELVMETMFGDATGVEEAYPVNAGPEAGAPSTSSAAKAFPSGPQHWAAQQNLGAAGEPPASSPPTLAPHAPWPRPDSPQRATLLPAASLRAGVEDEANQMRQLREAQNRRLSHARAAFTVALTEGSTAFTFAVLLAAEEQPAIPVADLSQRLSTELDKIAHAVRSILLPQGSWTPMMVATVASQVLFGGPDAPASAAHAQEGGSSAEPFFRGATADYYEPCNNFVDQVLERRQGIPITLSLVYAEVSAAACPVGSSATPPPPPPLSYPRAHPSLPPHRRAPLPPSPQFGPFLIVSTAAPCRCAGA